MARLDLDVFLEGIPRPIGELSRLDDGTCTFRYLTDAVPHPVSLSLPIRDEPFGDLPTRSFFSNLLFENAQRERVMQRHGIDYGDVVGLLAHLGADCPGSISCVPKGHGPAKLPGDLEQDYDPLDDQQIAQIMTSLRDLRRVPDETGDPSPLAGVQGKIALARLPDGRFALPKLGLNVPTTHILKVPRRGEMTMVEQEHLLMQLMAQLQPHPVAETSVLGEGDLRGLLVTRFDRVIEGSHVRRIHQEDFAQALGFGPQLKYERNGTPERRFDAAAIRSILEQTATPGRARQEFLEVTFANLLVGNTDNHAKNHALLYTGTRPEFAPVYDVAPVLIDDQVLHQLSFKIGSANMTEEITGADIAEFILAVGFPRVTSPLLLRLRSLVASAVHSIGEMQGPVRKRIGDAIAEQARWLSAALAVEIEVPDRDAVIINRP